MSSKTLQQLFAEHKGKVSDKWSAYVTQYERIFTELRPIPVRFLEIGIQNGGSLEIWAKYFPHAQCVLGCDINPDCARLSYEDPRIAFVIGDANSDTAQAEILSHAPAFDVIVDDGSHLSSDIVRSFARYFPHLADGGIFVVEDLHCSYWREFGGGLFHPFSAITFFKHLADVLNHEHWENQQNCDEILGGFFLKYGFQIDAASLQHVRSVEFMNSMCFIRKGKPESNRLGRRIVTGCDEEVVHGHLTLNGLPYSQDQAHDQTSYENNELSMPPGEELLLRINELAESDSRISSLDLALAESDSQISSLNLALAESDSRISSLNLALAERDSQISDLNETVTQAYEEIDKLDKKLNGLMSSLSMRITAPARRIKLYIKRHSRISHYRWISIRKSTSWLRSNVKSLCKQFLSYLVSLKKLPNAVDPHIHYNLDKPVGVLSLLLSRGDTIVSGWAVDITASRACMARARVNGVVFNLLPKARLDVKRVFEEICFLPDETGFESLVNMDGVINFLVIEIGIGEGLWKPIAHSIVFKSPFLILSQRAETSYEEWVRLNKQVMSSETRELINHVAVMPIKPKFSVVILCDDENTAPIINTLKTIEQQIYPHSRAFVLRTETGNMGRWAGVQETDWKFSAIDGNFIVFVKAGDLLNNLTLYEYANALNIQEEIDCIYADEDTIKANGQRTRPFFKPDYSPDYLEAFNYIGTPTAFRKSIAQQILADDYYDFVLRFTERTAKIQHIRKILGHRVASNSIDSNANQTLAKRKALAGRLERTGRHGLVKPLYENTEVYEIELHLKNEPLVSVILPTAGLIVDLHGREVDLLQNCVKQITSISSYRNVEIIVIDNGNLSSRQMDYIEAHGCFRTTYKDSVFNISKKLNLGARAAKGKYLLILNDDIEIITPNWIERMLEHFEKPHVGVVGVKLLYPDDTIQHAGVVFNSGKPDHVRRRFARDDMGYFFSTSAVHNFSAVTGACMMTPADVYKRVGGYSENLAVSYNDVDYCLKVAKQGLSIVYTPHAELIHFESISRVANLDFREELFFQRRWAVDIVEDSYYNERFLDLASPTFSVKINFRSL